MTSAVRNLVWISAAAAILLFPAVLWGRPFVFYDTPAYWGWGRDIVEAIVRPWPQPGQAWIAGRALHGWEIGAHGAGPGDLRFTLTLLTARSAFYAVPLYLLTGLGGLWLVAALQALAAAWTVHVVARALVPALSGAIWLMSVATLVALTSLGFETAYAMPDIFGGLALLAAGAVIACPDRFGPVARLGLGAVMAYAALAHTENGLNLAVAAALGVVLHFRAGSARLAASVLPIAAALGVALIFLALGGWGLNTVFGRPTQMAPFAASRVLADGSAQAYLRRACAPGGLAACDLAAAPPVYPEYYLGIYPLEAPPSSPPRDPVHLYDWIQFRSVSDAEAAHRERFVAEQGTLVLGALKADGPRLAALALGHGVATFMNFGVNRDFDSLQGLMGEHTQRRDQMAAITPNAARCAARPGPACAAFDTAPVAALQGLVVWASFALLAIGALLGPAARTGGEPLRPFAASMVGLVLANGLICGALAGPYDRYQSRVEWLIPLCAVLGLIQWVRRRASESKAAAGSDRPAPAIAIAGD